MHTRHLPFRIGVTLLTGLALALSLVWIGEMVPQVPSTRDGVWLLSIVLLGMLAAGPPAAGVLALALTWRASARGDARMLALFLGCIGVVLSGDGAWTLNQRLEMPRVVELLLNPGLIIVCMVAGLAALLRFSAIFPRPLEPGDVPVRGLAARVQRRLLDARGVWAAALLAFGLVALSAAAGHAASALWGIAPAIIGKFVLCAILAAAMSLAVLNLRVGYRRADAEGRRRIYWVVVGVFAATTLLLLASAVKVVQLATGFTVAVTAWFPFALVAAFLVMLGCLAIAMFYAGALDPALAMRRTAVFGLVGFAMIFVFTGMEQLVQAHLGDWLGLSDRLGGILTGGTAALTFEPIKRRTDALVGRLVEPDRRNPGVATS